MQLVRQFVAQVIEEQGGAASSPLSDLEWSRLCEAAGPAGSDESAIARVVMRAYGLGLESSPVPASGQHAPFLSPTPTVTGRFTTSSLISSRGRPPQTGQCNRPIRVSRPQRTGFGDRGDAGLVRGKGLAG